MNEQYGLDTLKNWHEQYLNAEYAFRKTVLNAIKEIPLTDIPGVEIDPKRPNAAIVSMSAIRSNDLILAPSYYMIDNQKDSLWAAAHGAKSTRHMIMILETVETVGRYKQVTYHPHVREHAGTILRKMGK